MSDCQHEATKRGRDIPRRYGSWHTSERQSCGAYRARGHNGDLITGRHGGWKPASGYESDTSVDDE